MAISLHDNITKWGVYVSCCLMFMMIAFDQNGLGVMLPQIQQDLVLTPYTQMWIINIYLLMIVSFMLVAGKLADFYNISTIFSLGIITFLLGSIGCGLSNSVSSLMFFRALQGIGAAFTLPLTFVLIIKGVNLHKQSAVMGNFISLSTIFFIIAPYVCGFITEYFGWRAVFLLNIPLCLISCCILFIACLKFPPIKNECLSFDIKGAVYLTITLLCLIYGVISSIYSNEVSYLESTIFILAGGISLLLFIRYEKSINNPLLEINAFKNPTFLICIIAAFCLQGIITVPILLSIYVQVNLNFNPEVTGLYLMMATTPSIITPLFCVKLTTLLGTRKSLQLGFIILSISLLIMSISAYFKFQNLIIIGLFIFSAAVTPLLSILINYALSVFPQTKSGIVSAMINLFRQIGAIFSMAFMSFMAYLLNAF